MSNQRKSRPHLEGFLLALAIFGVILLVAWNHSANAADLANDVSTAAVIDPEESPWYVPGAGPLHDRTSRHLEMGIQLERALDVAFDELRKVDQADIAGHARIHIYIFRHDLHVVEITGTRRQITVQLHELGEVCLPPHKGCPGD
jgi:hypothetical protein